MLGSVTQISSEIPPRDYKITDLVSLLGPAGEFFLVTSFTAVGEDDFHLGFVFRSFGLGHLPTFQVRSECNFSFLSASSRAAQDSSTGTPTCSQV